MLYSKKEKIMGEMAERQVNQMCYPSDDSQQVGYIPKFNLGDTAYHIKLAGAETSIPCKACSGKGEVMLEDGDSYNCPVCFGNGFKISWLPREWRVSNALTIGYIKIMVASKNHITHSYSSHKAYEEEYMCVQTGIFTGNVYKMDDLFYTKAEAQLECNRRNKGM
jgi:hypothetical protein